MYSFRRATVARIDSASSPISFFAVTFSSTSRSPSASLLAVSFNSAIGFDSAYALLSMLRITTIIPTAKMTKSTPIVANSI